MKLVFASSLVSAALAGPSSWGYETQPWQMGYCKPTEYARQSPIDIVTNEVVKATSPDTLIDAGNFTRKHLKEPSYGVRVNNITAGSAHSITFSFDQEVGDEKFSCPQFHCHFADSEHSVDDKKTFGECHTVCFDKEKYSSFKNATGSINGDELAVFGFFVEEDAHAENNAQCGKTLKTPLINQNRLFSVKSVKNRLEISSNFLFDTFYIKEFQTQVRVHLSLS